MSFNQMIIDQEIEMGMSRDNEYQFEDSEV